MRTKKVKQCPNCGFAKGHAHLCQQEAVWELEEMVSKLEISVQTERTKVILWKKLAKARKP